MFEKVQKACEMVKNLIAPLLLTGSLMLVWFIVRDTFKDPISIDNTLDYLRSNKVENVDIYQKSDVNCLYLKDNSIELVYMPADRMLEMLKFAQEDMQVAYKGYWFLDHILLLVFPGIMIVLFVFLSLNTKMTDLLAIWLYTKFRLYKKEDEFVLDLQVCHLLGHAMYLYNIGKSYLINKLQVIPCDYDILDKKAFNVKDLSDDVEYIQMHLAGIVAEEIFYKQFEIDPSQWSGDLKKAKQCAYRHFYNEIDLSHISLFHEKKDDLSPRGKEVLENKVDQLIEELYQQLKSKFESQKDIFYYLARILVERFSLNEGEFIKAIKVYRQTILQVE